jgi:hypothetical protein
MSWLFGVIGRGLSETHFHRYAGLHDPPLSVAADENIYVACGGIPATCLRGFNLPQGKNTGWCVTGLGMRLREGSLRFLSDRDWSGILEAPRPGLRDLEGHFVALRWTKERVDCFSDQFGLRTLYAGKISEGVAFSTRLDWVVKFMKSPRLNYVEFGSHWELFNQFAYGSLVHGVKRLGPGGHAVLTPTTLSFEQSPWTPVTEPASSGGPTGILKSCLTPQLEPPSTLSLGLSGGLDSRVLLSLLMARKTPVSLHLFGFPAEADVVIARRIATTLGIPQRYLNEPLPAPDACLPMLTEYVAHTGLSAPVSGLLRLRYYPLLQQEHKVMIDGGLGEIARCQFLNRLRVRGRHMLSGGSPSRLIPFLAHERSPVFAQDVRITMRQGEEEQILEAWKSMPTVAETGVDNFLDLLTVRYRYPNYGGPEQSRIDGQVVNYMPFAQPSFVNRIFSTPPQARRNGRLFRGIIRRNSPGLASVPLVKGTTTYPFPLPTVPAWAWVKVKKTIRGKEIDLPVVHFLHHLSEFVRDTARSQGVRSFDGYDHRYVLEMTDRFYGGDTGLASKVDWWLAFELWRGNMGLA